MEGFEVEPSLEEVLDEGVRRLKEKETWKLWTWPLDGTEFFDADAFRAHVTVGGGQQRGWAGHLMV